MGVIGVAILGGVFTILGALISFVLGARSEKQKMRMKIIADNITPIEEWVKGAEKLLQIFGDTYHSIIMNAPMPLTYSFVDRRNSSQFMSENRNRVLGILKSKVLQTRATKQDAIKLEIVIINLHDLLINQLLQLDLDLTNENNPTQTKAEFAVKACVLKEKIDALLVTANSLIAIIKPKLV